MTPFRDRAVEAMARAMFQAFTKEDRLGPAWVWERLYPKSQQLWRDLATAALNAYQKMAREDAGPFPSGLRGIANEFCHGAFKPFGISDERLVAYADVIEELLQHAVLLDRAMLAARPKEG